MTQAVEWVVLHVPSQQTKLVIAGTAFAAAQKAGWTFSECVVHRA